MKNKKNQDVRFVRIRGRIVPIRRKKSSGTKEIAAGVSVAAASGAAAGAVTMKTVAAGREARKQTILAKRAKGIGTRGFHFRKANQALPKIQQGFKMAKGVRSFGSLASGILIGQGISKKIGTETQAGDFAANLTGALGGALTSLALNKVLRIPKAKQLMKRIKK